MNIINNANFINFKSLVPFYYPRGRNVDRAEILAREIECRQILDGDDAQSAEESVNAYYGEQLSEDELGEKLQEVEAMRSLVKIDPFVPGEEDTQRAAAMPHYQTEETIPKKTGKLDIRG